MNFTNPWEVYQLLVILSTICTVYLFINKSGKLMSDTEDQSAGTLIFNLTLTAFISSFGLLGLYAMLHKVCMEIWLSLRAETLAFVEVKHAYQLRKLHKQNLVMEIKAWKEMKEMSEDMIEKLSSHDLHEGVGQYEELLALQQEQLSKSKAKLDALPRAPWNILPWYRTIRDQVVTDQGEI